MSWFIPRHFFWFTGKENEAHLYHLLIHLTFLFALFTSICNDFLCFLVKNACVLNFRILILCLLHPYFFWQRDQESVLSKPPSLLDNINTEDFMKFVLLYIVYLFHIHYVSHCDFFWLYVREILSDSLHYAETGMITRMINIWLKMSLLRHILAAWILNLWLIQVPDHRNLRKRWQNQSWLCG